MQTSLNPEEIAERGQAIYAEELRDKVEPAQRMPPVTASRHADPTACSTLCGSAILPRFLLVCRHPYAKGLRQRPSPADSPRCRSRAAETRADGRGDGGYRLQRHAATATRHGVRAWATVPQQPDGAPCRRLPPGGGKSQGAYPCSELCSSVRLRAAHCRERESSRQSAPHRPHFFVPLNSAVWPYYVLVQSMLFRTIRLPGNLARMSVVLTVSG
jgi:hypothetical protein